MTSGIADGVPVEIKPFKCICGFETKSVYRALNHTQNCDRYKEVNKNDK